MKVEVDKLILAVEEILVGLGETEANAKKIAEILVKADMRGISTHGVYLLNVIAMRVDGGQLRLPTEVEVLSEKDATVLIDGKDGIGMVAGYFALEKAIEKAKEYGIGISLIRNTNNVGCLGCYTEKAADNGMIAIMASNAAPAMAPWGAAEKFLGTNPIALSIPGDGMNFTMDMATSVVARGKIREAQRKGMKIPEGWALDAEGRPTTDPEAALKGTLMPIGGPKGSALAMAVDIICGLLAGSGYGNQLKSFHVLEGPTRVGASCIVIDVSRFIDLNEFKEKMKVYFATVKGLKKAHGVEEIFIPGEIEFRREKRSREEGVELDDKLASSINALLEKVGSSLRLN
ncbi:MAG: Ldh family oxidoreductase [Synergistetes bacterium]|nr:MAG: Malate/lactate dehydrogenase [bacterium 42_11]MBC7330919.1 Ldh family oxidoreductase [Synergistota bacterium]